ncbi:hypothetical protein Kim5_CH03773 [Rhizobium sp. Kim5]|nr:hypothetical protein Kim5_CH03773 [Rhizobium sp. Kim5]
MRCNCGGLLYQAGSAAFRSAIDIERIVSGRKGRLRAADRFAREKGKARPRPRLKAGCGSGADQLVAGECDAWIGDDRGHERQSDYRE